MCLSFPLALPWKPRLSEKKIKTHTGTDKDTHPLEKCNHTACVFFWISVHVLIQHTHTHSCTHTHTHTDTAKRKSETGAGGGKIR